MEIFFFDRVREIATHSFIEQFWISEQPINDRDEFLSSPCRVQHDEPCVRSCLDHYDDHASTWQMPVNPNELSPLSHSNSLLLTGKENFGA